MVDHNNRKGCPDEIWSRFQDLIRNNESVSLGLARHPEHGWFILATAGQGPTIVWREKEF